jgi:hypothetical protein
MTTHTLKHLLSELLVLGMVVCPFASVAAGLLGIAGWTMGGFEVGLWTTGIVLGATMGLAPIVVRVSCGPDTRVGCDLCRIPESRLLEYRREREESLGRRKHQRHQVHCPATFSRDGLSCSGRVTDLSMRGCRVRSESAMVAGELKRLRIGLPDRNAAVTVSRARVRWSAGNECGLEFLHMAPEELELLAQVLNTIGASSGISGRTASLSHERVWA